MPVPNYPIPCSTPECPPLAVRRVVITLTQSKLAESQVAGRTRSARGESVDHEFDRLSATIAGR